MSEVKLIRCYSHAAWLLERSKSIGSSDAAAVLGVSPFSTPLKVYASKVDPQPEEESEILKWGHRLEGPIADEFQSRNAVHVMLPAAFSLYRGEHEFMHATPDRLLRESVQKLVGVLEIKATRYKAADWDDGIPLHVQAQVQEQLLVLGLDIAYVAVLIQGAEYRQYEMNADRSFQSAMLEKLSEFWKRVQNREPPAPTGAADFETVKRMFARASRKTISLPAELTPEYELWVASRDARLACEKQEKAAAARLMMALGDAEEGLLPDGRRVTWVNEESNYKAQEARTITKRVLRLKQPTKEGLTGGTGSNGTQAISAGVDVGEVRAGADEVPPSGEGDDLRSKRD